MAERALVTGGAGFVGLHLVRRLLAAGTSVTVLDDFSRGRRDGEFDSLRDHIELVAHDLTQPVPDGLLPRTFDSVYHLAAIVGVHRATSEPSRVLLTNILATAHLLEWCDRNPPGAVFLSSTSEVADGAALAGLAAFPTTARVPFVLTDPYEPRSSYALSKAASESMLWLRRDRYRVRIGRYYNVYGPRMGNSHVIPQFISRIAAKADPFAIYGARQTRAFCYVDDAVTASIALTAIDRQDAIVANIGNDEEEITMSDLAGRLFRLAGVSPRVEVQPPPPGSPDRRLPDLVTLRALLPGYRNTPLDIGLRATFEWYQAELADEAA